jgi:dehydrogenase/reductase SDR family member 12
VARVREIIEVPLDPEAAFDHVADFTTSAQWDPSIASSERLDTGALRVGSRFEVRLSIGPTTLPLTYTITTYERPHRVVLLTSGPLHEGHDDVRFDATDGGSRVTWDARFALRGPGRLLDPLLAVGFRRTAAEAVRGLEAALLGLSSR